MSKEDLRQKFEVLAKDWKEHTSHLSNPNQIAAYSSHREIVAMGQEVIPLILEDYLRNETWWAMTLHEITGVNPYNSSTELGVYESIQKAWIDWGKTNGYIDIGDKNYNPD